MSHIWRVAWTIARRDYVAAVFSRLFLIFVLLPLIFAGIGGVFGAIGAMGDRDGGASSRPVLSVSDEGGMFEAISAASGRLSDHLGGDILPVILRQGPGDSQVAPGGKVVGVLGGGLAHPRLTLSRAAPDELPGQISLLVEDARAAASLAAAAHPAVTIARGPVTIARAAGYRDQDQVSLAKGAQYGMLVLTIMLAGRLLSSFVEERSNKVIEVLAAVAPVDAIFLGKLIGMLFFSLTCILAWGVVVIGGGLLLSPGTIAGIATPAIGWPLFAPLALLYFASCFLLLGAVMLGIGAQANSPADLQTLALPTTIAQLMLFGFASIGVGHPERWVAKAAAVFPWSSPLAMIARAAELPALWPHALAILWQGAWLALTIHYAARRFRRAVLKSGGGRPARA